MTIPSFSNLLPLTSLNPTSEPAIPTAANGRGSPPAEANALGLKSPSLFVPSVELVPVEQRPNAQQVADNILGFISQGLAARKEAGASDEELQSLFDQAVKGFEQGLAEAIDIIQSYGLLEESLEEQIAETESLVRAGLETLLADLGLAPQQPAQPPAIEPQSPSPSGGVITSVVGSQSESIRESFSFGQSSGNTDSEASSRFGFFSESFNSNRAIDLQVLTNDGDLVTFSFDSSFSSLEGGAFSYFNNNDTSFAGSSAFFSESSATSVSFSVQGDLDEGELASLKTLFEEVNTLATEFFDGDFDKAFEMALELKIDVSELAALSLDINQQVSQSSVAAYSEVSQIEPEQAVLNPAEQGFNQLREVGEYINKLLDTLDKVGRDIAEPVDLFADLLVKDIADKNRAEDDKPNDRAQRALALVDQLLEFLRA